jgi:hypothetical protein
MSNLRVLSAREAAIFTSLAESYCACGPADERGGFPTVEQTDAVAFIDDLTARSPRRNRVGFRALLAFADLAPLVQGYGARFRRLDTQARARFLQGLDKSRWQLLNIAAKLLKTLTMMSYYGADGALYAAGYDADAKVARGRMLRASRGLP